MNAASNTPAITLRIPGDWSHPAELLDRLPDGFRLTPEKLIMPGGSKIDFIPLPPDEQFPEIFKSACRRPPPSAELARVARYKVNVALEGPGGSLKSPLTMMQAAAAIVRAGVELDADNPRIEWGDVGARCPLDYSPLYFIPWLRRIAEEIIDCSTGL